MLRGGSREGSRGWHLSPPAAARLVQGSSRSCFSSVSVWQIPCCCRVPGYMWAALSVPLPTRDAVGTTCSVTGSLQGRGTVWEGSWGRGSGGTCRKAPGSVRDSDGGGFPGRFSSCARQLTLCCGSLGGRPSCRGRGNGHLTQLRVWPSLATRGWLEQRGASAQLLILAHFEGVWAWPPRCTA